MPDVEYSYSSYEQLLKTSKKFNWDVESFKGVRGDKIESNFWIANGLKLPEKTETGTERAFHHRKGAQGCFLSHYNLWNLCIDLNEPILILEHDVRFIHPWIEIQTDSELLKLCKHTRTRNDKYTGTWEVGAHAYIISPSGAKKIIEWVKNNFVYHADILIGSNILNWSNLDLDLVEVDKNNNISTTRMKKLSSV